MHGITLAIHFLSFLLCLLCAFLLIVEKMYEELKSEMKAKGLWNKKVVCWISYSTILIIYLLYRRTKYGH